MTSYRPCMANNPVGTKVGQHHHHQIISLKVVPFKGGQVRPPYCQAGAYSGVASTIVMSVGA